MIAIRKMHIMDVETIETHELAIFGSSLGQGMLIQELLENPVAHYFVLEFQEEIIGYIGMWIEPPTAQILNYYIIPTHQKRGHGTLLLTHALDYMKQRGVTLITLEVRPSNTKAIALYERYGFKSEYVRKNYYSDGENALLMVWREKEVPHENTCD